MFTVGERAFVLIRNNQLWTERNYIQVHRGRTSCPPRSSRQQEENGGNCAYMVPSRWIRLIDSFRIAERREEKINLTSPVGWRASIAKVTNFTIRCW